MMPDNTEKGGGSPRLIPKTTKAREYHERYYLPRSAKVIGEINSQPLSIFVCGPSEKSNQLTLKKLNTINELRRLGHDANSGEELVSELKGLDADGTRTANVYENIAAVQSELIIVFCASPGSIGETYEFLNVPEIARKTMVFIDRKHRGGYAREGLLEMHRRVNGLVEEYEPEDIDSCRLTARAIQWVRDLQSWKWMTGRDLLGEKI